MPERQSWKRGSKNSVNALLQKIKSRSLLLSGGVGAGRCSRGWPQRGFRPGCGSVAVSLPEPLTVPTKWQSVGAGGFN